MNSVISNNLSLKYQGFTPSGCWDIGVRKFEFLTDFNSLEANRTIACECLLSKFKKNFLNTIVVSTIELILDVG